MKCTTLTHDMFLDYADNRLPGREAMEIKQHLGQCARCRRLLAEVTTISSSVRRSPDLRSNKTIAPEMDMAALAEIKTISQEIRRKSNWIPWRVAMAYAAAALIAVTAVVALQNMSNRPLQNQGPGVTQSPTEDTSKPQPVATPVKPETPRIPEKRTPPPEVVRSIPGDLNNDRVVDIADAMLLERALLENTPPDHGDVTGDRRVDINDVRAIMLKTLVPQQKE